MPISLRQLCLALPLATLAACATEDPTPVLQDTEAYMDREIIVGVADGVDGMRLAEIEREYGLKTMNTVGVLGVARLELPEGGEVKEFAERLRSDPRIAFAEPNYIVRALGVPNDPYAGYQWNMEAAGVWDAHDTTDGSGVIVAVLDTGVSKSGEDSFDDLLQGYDFYYGDTDPSDQVGHGTHVAGTVAQSTDNGRGVSGVAPGASILPVKVLSDNGYGDLNSIVNGIVWATDEGADIINMSLGSASPSSSMEQAVNYAASKGVLVIAASGNEYSSSVGYPAAFDNALAVGASGYSGGRAAYSNTGAGLFITAPGGDMGKDENGDGYADGILQETREDGEWSYLFYEGTSMASPHVAGIAALVASMGVTDPGEIADILASTARDRGASGYDTTYGYGLIDAAAAVAAVDASDDTDPDDDVTEPEPEPEPEPDPEPEPEPEPEADTTAPTISNVSGFTQDRQFTIEWTTNEPADSYLNFDEYGRYGDDELKTAHSITLTGSYGYTYYFSIESDDAEGNRASTDSYYISL